MKRRALLLLVTTAAVLVGTAAACSFPSVEYGEQPGSGADSAARDGASGDAPFDAPVTDADQRTDATQRVDEAGCMDPCDCDKDGHVNKSCLEAGANPDLADCDDFDPLRYPSKTSFTSEVPPADNGGDWNCDHVVDHQYATGLKCGSACGAEGFTSEPTCGQLADYFKCTGMIICTATKIDQRKQGCR